MTLRIFGLPEETLRVKSFSSSTKGTKGVIRIELETSDLFELGFTLRTLDEVQKGQRRKPEPKPKPKAEKPTLLALPAPLRALPSTDREE